MGRVRFLPKNIRYILTNYIFGVIVFFVFRVILLLANLDLLEGIEASKLSGLLLNSFTFGLRFDTVILCYILAFPTLLLVIFSFFDKIKFNYYKAINCFILVFYFLVFFISLADIPYFNQFLERITVEIFEWMNTPLIVLKMVVTDKTNLVFFVILFMLLGMLFAYYKLVLKKYQSDNCRSDFNLKLSLISLILLPFLFLGIRGRIAIKSPIRVGTAFFSDYSFINKLGLNPSFTLIKSVLKKNKNKEIRLVDNDFALEYLNSHFSSKDKKFPLMREVNFSGEEKKYNVVLIIVESMTAKNLEKYGGDKTLTPFLNSLVSKSLIFNNFYSSGIHTYNGIYSCLTSFPTVLKKHSMKGVIIPRYNGISNVLKTKNYRTLFFINHDSEFDNIGGFVKTNDFDLLISQKDYPKDKVVSSLGVGDDFMFEFSIDKFNKQKEPFFACFMTASNHGPYKIPEYADFTPKSSEIKKQLIEYTDWSLKKFIDLAKKQSWFDNTLFVITGDHGRSDNTPYGISFAYHRVPLIVYAPQIIKPEEKNGLGCQIDIFPVIMHLLNASYVNNTYGVDLLAKERKRVFFTNNENIACLDNEYLFVHGKNTNEGLFKYKNLATKNYLSEKSEVADDMKNYVFSMLQSSQWLIRNKRVYRENNEQCK